MLHCTTCGRTYLLDLLVCPEDDTLLQADATVADGGDPLLGRTLDDKYRIETRLGAGGMGTVYQARHLLIERPVAVKVLNRRFVEDEGAQIRFRREAKAAGRLQHANAVAVTDFGQTSDGYVYLVMELLQGRTLRDVLAQEGPLETARAVSLMLQASSAVAAAHEAGIIHRDLKPANIFIAQRSDVPALVKVLDFGIAKLVTESLDEDDVKTITLVGAMIGTPRYMSPEQCDGAELTPAADVYSLGVILYEMLTGTVPFSGSTPLAIAVKHAAESPRSPREIVNSIPPELERVVLHALEKLPQDRPANAAEFRQELWETAERLGLEHASTTISADLEALRNVGTESPSGRLVIDLSRLRETRSATASASSEVTVLSQSSAETVGDQSARSFPRVSVSFGSNPHARKSLVLPAVIIGLAIIVGVAFLAFSFRDTPPMANLDATATPSPTVAPTPTTPSPSPSPTGRPDQEKPKPDNANKKKDTKVESILKKAGRILKKPF